VLVRDLLGNIGKAPLPPVLLFCPGKAPFGKEPFEPVLVDEAVKRIVDKYVEPGMHDLAYSVFYADETSAGQITLEAQTLPFLAERRVILVRNAERYDAMSGEKNSPLSPLIAYLENPSESTLMLIVAAKADKRKKLFKAVSALNGIVECPQLDDRELEAWLRDAAHGLGKRIDGKAIGELTQRAGGRLSDVQNALRVVAGYVGVADQIRAEDVVAACADVAEESVWALTDAIAASDTPKALHTLHQLIDLGKSPDEIMGLINWLLESAYQASPASGKPLKSSFVAKKVTPLLDKLGLEKLKSAFALCTNTHFMIRSTGVDKDLALELLVIKLAAGRRPGAKVPARR
jgi:DNA polymerase-3 subunit delta